MNKGNRQTRIIVVLAFMTLNFFNLNVVRAMEGNIFDENAERQWRTSLNVYNAANELILDVGSWLEQTFNAIDVTNEVSIRSKFEKKTSVEQNIATGRFTIIYSVNNTIQSSSYDLTKIFVSGLNSLDPNNIHVQQQNLLDHIIFPVSFIEGNRPSGKEINQRQQDKVNLLLGRDVVKSGTHAEESLLLYLDKHLRNFIAQIPAQDFTIIGTVLEISTLKDPCTDVCMPMLKAFMDNLSAILQANIPENVTLAPQLENLVLLSGRKAHIESRNGMAVVDTNIQLNFDHPSNRIYSSIKD
ncbi:MAG: hypothetical protein K0M45_12255 [Candidatus Paracaedibacteraceae bacterium]|nr:hypothetical protein [Candidatus Paracaedibacteraceae bacterium]